MTSEQLEFVDRKQRVFISYSRADADIADSVANELKNEGYEVLIDRRDLPYAEAWMTELTHLIRSSDSVVWLVSSHSSKSQWVRWELDLVSKLRKRLIPVRIGIDEKSLQPEEISHLQILPSVGIFEFSHHFETLVEILETDNAWVKAHTRYADRALEWSNQHQSKDLLLSGAALKRGQNWIEEANNRGLDIDPEVSALVQISANAARTRRKRSAAIITATALIVALGSWAGFSQFQLAQSNAIVADQERITRILDSAKEAQNAGSALKALALNAEAVLLSGPKKTSIQTRAVRQLMESKFELRELAHFRSNPDTFFAPPLFRNAGTQVILPQYDGLIQIRSIPDEKILASFSLENELLPPIYMTSDESQLIATDRKGKIYTWDIDTQTEICRFQGQKPSNAIQQVFEDKILTTQYNIYNPLYYYDLESCAYVDTMDPEEFGLNRYFLAIADEGSIHFLASNDFASFVNPREETSSVFEFEDHLRIQHVNIDEERDLAILSLSDGATQVQKISDGSLMHSFKGSYLWDLETALSKETLSMLALKDEGLLFHWSIDGKAGNRVPTDPTDPITSINILRFGWNFATGSINGKLQIWSGRDELLATVQAHDGAVDSVTTDASQTRFLTMSRDGSVKVWSRYPYFASRTLTRSGGYYADPVPIPDSQLVLVKNITWMVYPDGNGFGDSVGLELRSLVDGSLVKKYPNIDAAQTWDVSSDGKQFLTVHKSGHLRVWDRTTGELIKEIYFDEPRIFTALFGPLDQFVLTSHSDEKLRKWNTRNWELQKTLDIGKHHADSMEVDVSSRFVIANNNTYGASIWDLNTGEAIGTGTNMFDIAAISPDGLIYAGADRYSAGIYRVSDEEKIAELDGPSGAIISLAFSKDGKKLLTGSRSNSARVWNTETGALELTLRGHEDRVSSVRFMNNDSQAMTSSRGQVIVWDISESDAQLTAHSTLDAIEHIYPLTEEEACDYGLPRCSIAEEMD